MFLNTVFGYLNDSLLFFFVMVVHESLVCSEQLNWALFFRKIIHDLYILQFQHLLHIWTLYSSDCMILRSIFSHWGQSRGLKHNIKKGSNIHWCSWRNHDALRAGGENFWTGWRFFFLFCWNIYIYIYIFFFHLVLPFRSNRRYLDVSRKTN